MQQAEEEGSIGATGALATALGSGAIDLQDNANPLGSAGPSSTGIPIISSLDDLAESLPAVKLDLCRDLYLLRQPQSVIPLLIRKSRPAA